ncbi:MAG: DNA-3-methyladenine glycosylase [Firmicutes bacterium]|nr:DNA-3-methyladenine glycosylase [Bacillota bacterium]
MTKKFYIRPATETAPLLLGKFLCRNAEGNVIKRRITETEIYFGEDDTACHARSGVTRRTWPLYEQGGIAYVYLCYGIHNLFNVVTGEKGFPQAVLIRGVEGFDGPGKLTKHMKIDRSLNAVCLVGSNEIWLEDDGFLPKFNATKRIGIDYASEHDRNRLWRFVAEDIT